MSTVMARRDFFSKVGFFDETFLCCEDYELWLRASISEAFLKIDEPLTCKQGGREDQVSSQFRVGMDRLRIQAMEKVAAMDRGSAPQHMALARHIAQKAKLYGQGCRKYGRYDEALMYKDKEDSWQVIARQLVGK
jgi:hypothetical protein